MNSNARIASAILIGAGSWFLGCHVRNVMKQNAAYAAKRLAKSAVHAWENEGGALIEPAVRKTIG